MYSHRAHVNVTTCYAMPRHVKWIESHFLWRHSADVKCHTHQTSAERTFLLLRRDDTLARRPQKVKQKWILKNEHTENACTHTVTSALKTKSTKWIHICVGVKSVESLNINERKFGSGCTVCALVQIWRCDFHRLSHLHRRVVENWKAAAEQ